MNADRYIKRLFEVVTDAVTAVEHGDRLDAADIQDQISKQLAALQAEATNEGFAAGYKAAREERC